MKILLLGLVSVSVQLGLAIAGWGGFAAFFSHPLLVALTVTTFLLTGVAGGTQGNLSSGEREDRGNRWVLAAFGILSLLVAYLPAYTDRRNVLVLDGDAVRWAGIVIFLIGGVLRLWPVFVLGPRFSGLVAIQPEHTLVTTGIYRVVRNPSYVGLVLGALGWALTFRSLVGVVITALLLIPLVARIRSEEQLLAEHFGTAYEDYRARTWRLVPGIY